MAPAGVDLGEVRWNDADLRGADLRYVTDIGGAYMAGALLDGAQACEDTDGQWGEAATEPNYVECPPL